MIKFNWILLDIAGRFMFPARPVSSLAHHLGLSRQYASKLMNGKAPIPPSLWVDLERLVAERLATIDDWHERLVDHRKMPTAPKNGSTKNMPPLNARHFGAIGTALFGEAWAGPLAGHMRKSPEYMRKLAKGERPMRDPLWRMLEGVCEQQFKQLTFLETRLSLLKLSNALASDQDLDDPSSLDDTDRAAIRALIITPTFH